MHNKTGCMRIGQALQTSVSKIALCWLCYKSLFVITLPRHNNNRQLHMPVTVHYGTRIGTQFHTVCFDSQFRTFFMPASSFSDLIQPKMALIKRRIITYKFRNQERYSLRSLNIRKVEKVHPKYPPPVLFFVF